MLTTQLAKLHTTEKPKCQSDLDFVPTVKVVNKRNRSFYQSIWKVTAIPMLSMYQKYMEQNPDSRVSKGTFFNLKPFYIRGASQKDIQMCLCKLHLHTQWSFKALLEWAKAVGQPVDALDYCGILIRLTQDCDAEEQTYISWECTPDKDQIGEHIKTRWPDLKTDLAQHDEGKTVSFSEFQNKVCTKAKGEALTNKGEPIIMLQAVKHDVPLTYVVEFIEVLLPKITHHRNLLKLYRNTQKLFPNMFNCVYIDADFSKNLTISIKWEPQSLYWSKTQVTVHSGIVKTPYQKTYHPYLSDSREHDQTFVYMALKEMLDSTEITDLETIIIESDNCTVQYKSAEHFADIQKVSDEHQRPVIRLYGIAGHSKGEVDHVRGDAKVVVQDEIARGTIFARSSEIMPMLTKKFRDKERTKYHIVEIKTEDLDAERKSHQRKKFEHVKGSSVLQVIIFKPDQPYFKAATRLCICDQCSIEYGSCEIFSEYILDVSTYHVIPFQSKDAAECADKDESTVGEENVDEFITPGSFVAIAPNKESIDSIWFMFVKEVNIISNYDETDDYGHVIPPGNIYHIGSFMEKQSDGTKSTLYKLSKKTSIFYNESILFPFVNFKEGKHGHSISNEDLTDILIHMEQNSFAHV